jgi:predicted phage terminase large subunit-like protein
MTLYSTERPDLLSYLRSYRQRRQTEWSLHEFCKQAWHTIEGRPFSSGVHIEMICEHLQAVADQQILRLLINLPPRHMKSLVGNVFFPAWVWAQTTSIDPSSGEAKTRYAIEPKTWRGPGVQFLCISHRESLAADFGAQCRRVIEHDWYQRLWGDRFTLASDQNQKMRFDTDRGGFRIAGNTNITGRGGNIVIYDDPHELMRGESEVERSEVLRFHREVLPYRLNPGPSALIVIMQRSHARDVSGHIIANQLDATLLNVPGPWEPTAWRHLCLPARFESDHPHPLVTDCTRSGTGKRWKDERKEGDPLWPEMFPKEVLDQRAKDMTEYAIAGQLQQRPVAREGGMFKYGWFADKFLESTDIQPQTKYWRHWDLAASKHENADYTCGVRIGQMPDGRFVVVDVIRVRLEGHDVRKLIKDTADKDGRHCGISIPKDGGQAGKVQAADFVRLLAGFDVHTEAETGSKETRAKPVAAQAFNGNLYIKRASWNDDYLEELCLFPAAPHDDQVDATSGAFARFVITVGEHSSGWMTGLH